MEKKTITVSANPEISIPEIHGDLRVAGWERNEILAKTDGDQLDLETKGDEISIKCDEDLILYLPRNGKLNVGNIAGDASLQAFSGEVSLGAIAGDVSMNDIGPTSFDKVAGDAALRNIGAINGKEISGDFSLRNGHGVCAVSTIGGDASIRDVEDKVLIDSVGSDLYLRNVRGSITAQAGADIALYIEPLTGETYDLSAGNDLILRMAPISNAKLHLAGKNIQVDFEGVDIPEDSQECDVQIGEEKDGMATMMLTAGDDLLVTSQADPWDSAADFGVGMRDNASWPLPPDFAEQINQRVQDAMGRAHSHMETWSRNAEHAGHRASIKIEAAMRRAEAKARAAEVRARRGQVSIGRWKWGFSSDDQATPNAPISDEERMTILKMLQEKKISVEDAEKLLAALEGK